LKCAADTGLATSAEAPEHWSSNRNGISAERKSAEYVDTATHASVDDGRDGLSNRTAGRFDARREDIRRRWCPVKLTAAVV
jgi:hypothetical protein